MPVRAVVLLLSGAVLAGAAAPSHEPANARAAAVVSIPAPVGLEKKLVDDAQDGKLDNVTLLDGALIASGVPDAEVPQEAERVRRTLAPSIAKAKAESSAHKRGEVLLKA